MTEPTKHNYDNALHFLALRQHVEYEKGALIWTGTECIPITELIRLHKLAPDADESLMLAKTLHMMSESFPDNEYVEMSSTQILREAINDPSILNSIIRELGDENSGLSQAIDAHNARLGSKSVARTNTVTSLNEFKRLIDVANVGEPEAQRTLNLMLSAEAIKEAGVHPHSRARENPLEQKITYNNVLDSDTLDGITIPMLVESYLRSTKSDDEINSLIKVHGSELAVVAAYLRDQELWMEVVNFSRDRELFRDPMKEIMTGKYGRHFDVTELRTPESSAPEEQQDVTLEEFEMDMGARTTNSFDKVKDAVKEGWKTAVDTGRQLADEANNAVSDLANAGDPNYLKDLDRKVNLVSSMGSDQRLRLLAESQYNEERFKYNVSQAAGTDIFPEIWNETGQPYGSWTADLWTGTLGAIEGVSDWFGLTKDKRQEVSDKVDEYSKFLPNEANTGLTYHGEPENSNATATYGNLETFILKYHDQFKGGLAGMDPQAKKHALDYADELTVKLREQANKEADAFNVLYHAGFHFDEGKKKITFVKPEENAFLKRAVSSIQADVKMQNIQAGDEFIYRRGNFEITLEALDTSKKPAELLIAYQKQFKEAAFDKWLEAKAYTESERIDILEDLESNNLSDRKPAQAIYSRFMAEYRDLAVRKENSKQLHYQNLATRQSFKGPYDEILVIHSVEKNKEQAQTVEDNPNLWDKVTDWWQGDETQQSSQIRGAPRSKADGGDNSGNGDAGDSQYGQSEAGKAVTEAGYTDKLREKQMNAVDRIIEGLPYTLSLYERIGPYQGSPSANDNIASGLSAASVAGEYQQEFDYAVTEMRDKAEFAILQIEAAISESENNPNLDKDRLTKARNEIERAAQTIGSEADSKLPSSTQWARLAATDAYLDRIIEAGKLSLDRFHEVISKYDQDFSKVSHYQSDNQLSSAAAHIVLGVQSDAPAQGYEAIADQYKSGEFKNDSQVLPRLTTRAKTLAKEKWEAVKGNNHQLAEHLVDEFNQEIRRTDTFKSASKDTQQTLIAMTAMVQNSNYFTNEDARKTAEDALHAIFTEVKALEAGSSSSIQEDLNAAVDSYNSQLKGGLNLGSYKNNPEGASGGHLLQAITKDVTITKENDKTIEGYIHEADKPNQKADLNLSSF